MIKYIATVVVVVLSFIKVFASPQMPDYIIYKKDTIATYNLLVEQYLQKKLAADSGKLFGLSFRNGASFNCWRGYQAIYKVENDSIFLAGIIDCGTIKQKTTDEKESVKKMQAIFGNRLINGKVLINWFSGDLNFSLTNKILRWDGVFSTIYEEERVMHVSDGIISGIEDVNNYVDDPKAIDRKYGVKISDILFKKIKKIKLKHNDDCDCSEKYLITINEKGNISNVATVNYKTANDVTDTDNKKEYRYCTGAILKALKGVKFDIIKDKGKPIPETVYMEIWIEDDGKIENWTR